MQLLQRNPKGQVLVLVALIMVVIVGVAALAVDLGMAYGVKAKLSAAVDAAAIAAVKERTSASGSDSSASQAANCYLKANFPYQAMGVAQPVCDVFLDTSNGVWTASVDATTVVPTRFAQVVGWSGVTVHANSQATKAEIDLALVLDTTSSLRGVFGSVRDGAINFLDNFNQTGDRVALVPFATGVSVSDAGGELVLKESGVEINKYGRGFDKNAVVTGINAINIDPFPGNETYTNSEFGIRMGMYQLDKVQTPAPQRAIVFFSDGVPNTFTGKFPIDAAGNAQSGSLYSEAADGKIPHSLYLTDTRTDGLPATISLYRVPDNGGGNKIGTVEILPTLPVDSPKRPVKFVGSASTDQKCDVNYASRNLLESVANYARSRGIVIYTLGYGKKLEEADITGCPASVEKGSTILKRVANSRDSDTYDSGQPTGLYCYAETAGDLRRCFNRIANSLVRIKK